MSAIAFDESRPVLFDDDLPSQVDVVIIGGGVIGIYTAWFLNKAGLSVFICDKGRVAGEQSSRNWGWVRQQGRDAAELPIMIDAMQVWDEVTAKLGDKVGFKREGTLYIASTESELASLEQWLKVAEPHQLDTRMLSRQELDDKVEGNTGNWAGALYTGSDGRAEPFTTVPAIAQYLHSEGVGIKENCAVRCLELEIGKISGVVTEHGTIKTNQVVLAGGAWSSRFLHNHGVSLPQLSVRATVARTESAAEFYTGNAADEDVAFRRRNDGGYTMATGISIEHFIGLDSFRYFFKFLPVLKQSARTISLHFEGDLIERFFGQRRWNGDEETPFERTRMLNPDPSARVLAKVRRNMKKKLPAIADVPFAQSWAGMIDVMPDVVPVMDRIDQIPGLVLGTGFSGHGFGFGPGAGRVLSDLILENDSPYDLSRFRYQRFFDGTPMVPGPGI